MCLFSEFVKGLLLRGANICFEILRGALSAFDVCVFVLRIHRDSTVALSAIKLEFNDAQEKPGRVKIWKWEKETESSFNIRQVFLIYRSFIQVQSVDVVQKTVKRKNAALQNCLQTKQISRWRDYQWPKEKSIICRLEIAWKQARSNMFYADCHGLYSLWSWAPVYRLGSLKWYVRKNEYMTRPPRAEHLVRSQFKVLSHLS